MTEPDVAELFRKVDEALLVFVEGWLPHSSRAGTLAIKKHYADARLALREIARRWPAIQHLGVPAIKENVDDSQRRAILKALGEKP